MAAKPNPKKTGPKPETLKVEGNWKDAVAHALGRGKPPQPEKPRRKRKKR
jgi:hypothetical protein